MGGRSDGWEEPASSLSTVLLARDNGCSSIATMGAGKVSALGLLLGVSSQFRAGVGVVQGLG